MIDYNFLEDTTLGEILLEKNLDDFREQIKDAYRSTVMEMSASHDVAMIETWTRY